MKTNWKFCNFPVYRSPEEYEQAKQAYVEEAFRYPDVESVYQLGEISAPGISDLDFIFVVDPEAPVQDSAPSLSELHRMLGSDIEYLICHEPMGILTGRLLSNIHWLLPTDGLRRVSGRHFNICIPSETELCTLRLSVLADYVRTFWPWEFLRDSVDQRIDVRMTLLRLNSFSHSLAMYGELIEDKNPGGEFRKNLDRLRADWFSHNQEKNLEELFELMTGAISLGWSMIESVSEILAKQAAFFSADSRKLSAEFENIRRYYFFSDLWTRAEAEKLFREAYMRFGFQIHFLPAPFVWPLIQYSHADGLLGRRICRSIHLHSEVPMRQSKTLLKRAELMNEHLEFLSAHGWLCGLFNPNNFGMFDEGRLHPSGKRWLHKAKTLYCWHVRRPFFRYKNRNVFMKCTNSLVSV